ncbi:MAG TPA: LysE family transporter [Burkholderiales bacterium]|nr:LysE family transporter [Burkholderiales bacterium]
MDPLLKGIIVGFSIAAPLGPIGVLCVRRSLTNGPFMGLLTGLGAATADAAYGFIAAFGVTAVSIFLLDKKLWLSMIGGVFLCYLGIATFRRLPANDPASISGASRLAAYASTFLLTLSNPTTILSFIAIFAAFGLGAYASYSAASAMVLGVFLGSALWWIILSSSVGLLRTRLSRTWMAWINRISGAMILAFGLLALGKATVSWLQ